MSAGPESAIALRPTPSRPIPAARRRVDTGRAIEWALLAVGMLLTSDAVVVLIATGGQGIERAEEGGSRAFQVLIGLFYATILAGMLPRVGMMLRILKRNGPLVGVLAVALFSTLWSVSPELTIRRSVALLLTTVFGIWVSLRFRLKEMLTATAGVMAVLAGLSLVFVFALPSYGIHPDGLWEGYWRGVFVHKNGLGRTMGLGAAVAFGLMIARTKGKGRMLGAAFLMLAGMTLASRSATAALTLLATVLATLVFARLRQRRRLVMGLMLSLMLVVAVGQFAVYRLSQLNWDPWGLFELLGKDITLTGRTLLWEYIGGYVADRPWLGYGFKSFWLSDTNKIWMMWESWEPIAAHNASLELALDFGLVGAAFFLVCLVQCVCRVVNHASSQRETSAIGLLAFMVFFLLSGVAEGDFLARNSFAWVLFVIALIHQQEPIPAAGGERARPPAEGGDDRAE